MKLVIVEDEALQREGLTLLLRGEPNLEVVGAFATGEDALRSLDALRPDVLLADLGLPGMSGVELIRTVKARHPDCDAMALTVFEERETVLAALKAGASGYLLKGSSPKELVEAIHGLRAGGGPMSPKIARAVIRELQEPEVADQYLLSVREREILTGVERGLTYREIAEELDISPHTVHTHVKKAYEKLQAKDRREALTKAKRKGIL